MKTVFWAALLTAASTLPVLGQESSFQITGSVGTWSNQDGGSNIISNEGINGENSRTQGDISLGYARTFGNFTGVGTLHYGAISVADPTDDFDADEEDATKYVADITLRGLMSRGDMTFGVFLGSGRQDDYGDADEDMTYEYAGLEFSKDLTWGNYYTQVGYVNGEDQYDESLQDATFVNVGTQYDLQNGFALTGAVGVAQGDTESDPTDDTTVLDVTIGAERDFGNFVGFVELQQQQIYYEDGADNYGDTFTSFSVGVTMTFGGDVSHGTPLPDLGRWVAYKANEIE
jgi:hypothetical protein